MFFDMPPIKAKPKHLDIASKAKILNDLKKGISAKRISLNMGIHVSTVSRIKKAQNAITNEIAMSYKGTGKRKYLRRCEHPEMENRLYNWFLLNRARNVPMNGLLLKEKAKALVKETSNENVQFNASDGWFSNFRRRYGIRHLSIAGEKLSSCPENVAPFKCKLKQRIQEMRITSDQIYNADESGLYWKLLPTKTFVSSDEKTAPGRKVAKDRLTFMVCTNASGTHKLKLLVIGKAKNPRSFKDFAIPVNYRHSKSAWMNAFIFKDWFHNCFVTEVTEFQRRNNLSTGGLLLLDNAPSHPPEAELVSTDGKFSVLYLPPNVTPLVQPMDQNIIKLTKLYYRNSLLASIVANEDIGVAEALKKMTVKDVIVSLVSAWSQIKERVITSCWKKFLDFSNNPQDENEQDFSSDDEIPLTLLKLKLQSKTPSASFNTIGTEVQQITTENINLLNEIGKTVHTSVDVTNWNMDTIEEEEISDDEGSTTSFDVETPAQRISHQDAIMMFNGALRWVEQNNRSFSEIALLQNLRDAAVKLNVLSKLKQKKNRRLFY